MAYDEDLADQIREALSAESGITERKMFGGLAFLQNGNMAVAASGQGGLLVRCLPGTTEQRLSPGVVRMEMGGRELGGWLRVEAHVLAPDDSVARWVEVGLASTRSLPAK